MGDLDLIGRLTKFCDEWAKMRSKGDDIYGLHMGEDREAVLCASDIRQAADEIARLREALGVADAAIKEWFRYLHGGEMRGSYDGKPEREQLRKAGYVTTAALQHKEPQG
ncbi:MAG: hypothetical protein CL858_29555 [Cupriavidus sp.]|uniref:hypothetical protein n=1 Tax=Sphingobium sp. TaxID=1912891 RepID=UPI000C5C3358|nr:hypothetical protein [Sphingobium sp.]MBS87184.1 hypothetical protein [Sphingobium sp.]MBU69526.1 hypothetical protein [Cupriavidus sp.]